MNRATRREHEGGGEEAGPLFDWVQVWLERGRVNSALATGEWYTGETRVGLSLGNTYEL